MIVHTIERQLMRSGATMRVHTEYMDSKHFSDKAHYANLYTLLKNKARRRQHDVIITVDNNALLFLLEYRNELYPNVPIVFCAVDRYHDSMYEVRPAKTTINKILAGHESVTGVLEEFDHEATIEVALHLHPLARRVILINDGVNKVTYYPNLSDHDAAALAEKFAGRAEFENLLLTESNLDQILEKINQHGKDSIVLLTNSFLDRQANLSLLEGKLPTFWQRCNVPVYVVSRTLLELAHPVGGSINSDYPQGKIAAEMAVRILRGESASSIPIVRRSPNTYIFNYPQMRRFGIELADLPPGSTVLNQPQSFYYLYKRRIWAVIGIIVGLLILVIMLEVNTLRRKRAEEKLRTKNIAIESSINAIAFADMNGGLTDVNNSFLRMWGYADGRQVLGKSLAEFWADERKAAQVIETVMNQGSWIGELTAKRKDNSTFDAEVSASLVKDEVGNPVCVMASFIDVTERERAEKALRQSEEKYRLVIENTQDLMYSISPDGTVTFVSPQVSNLGYSVQEVVGRNISKFIHPDDIQHVMANLAQTLATGEAPSLECRLLKKDGSYIWVEETGSAVHKGDEIVQITGSIRDVTERKRAEEALRESEHRYKALFEGTAEGIVVADIQTKKFMYASPAFCAMLGYTEDEVKKLGVEDIHPQEHLRHVLSEFEAQARGEKSLAPDVPCRKKNGEIIYADINTARVVIDGRKCNVGFFTDITDRKQAEDELYKAEVKYRTLVEQIPAVTYIAALDKASTTLYISPQIETLVGFARKEYEKDPDIWRKRLHPDDRPRVMAQLERTHKDNQPFSSEYRMLARDGRLVWFRDEAAVVKDSENQPLFLQGVMFDITERKLAEKALQDSEEKYRRIVESLRQEYFFYSHGPDGVFDYVSPSIENVLGYSRKEFLTHYTEYLTDSRINAPVVHHTNLGIQGQQQPPYEVEIYHKDRSIHRLEVTEVPVIDEEGNVVAVEGIAHDITDRRKAQDALRQSEEQYRTLTHNIPGMVYTANPDWSANVVSNSMAVCGYSVEDFNTRKVNWLDIIHPDDREWVVREASKLGSHRTAVIQEYRIIDKADRMRWVEDRKTPQFTLDREYRGVDGIVFDITERKHAEEALQKARDELEMRVQQRTADLAKAIEELRNEIAERKKAENKLLISQNQLRSLASELSLAEERLRRKIATDVHDHVGQNLAISKIKLESLRESTSSPKLVRSLDEIRELVAQTIESTRTLTFELSPPVLYELGFEAAVEWLVRQTRERHKLSAQFKDDGRPKPLDNNVRVLLFQAVRELLVNVAKHAQAASVNVSTRRAGEQIQISVEDDGVGFDTSDISSRSRTAGGFGLFSIRERLGHIGGNLSISSRQGRGTRVTLVAPLNSHKNNNTEKGK